MDILGPNLERLLAICGGSFSLKTTLMLALQMLDRIENFHNTGLIHRDIKPENFVMGSTYNIKSLYMIDFGIAKLLKNSEGEHINYCTGKGLIGTARYASINSHEGVEQSRRDDLEGVAYTLIYFLKGKLPWQDVRGENKKHKYEQIKKLKMNISIQELCHG